MSPIKFPKSADMTFTKNMVKRHKLVTHLDRYLSKEVTDFEFVYEPKVGDDAWHPSGHCTPSVTDLYEIATGQVAQKDWGTSMLKTFMVGHFWHQLLQKAVLDLGFAEPEAIERRGIEDWSDSEDPLSDPLPFHWATGAGDVAPCSIPGYGDYVIDFKTQNSRSFKETSLPGWCADKYEAQINIYMDFFDLENGLIVCIDKDSPHGMKEFTFNRNQPLIEAIYAKWRFVSGCLDSDEAPTAFDDEEFSLSGLFTGPVA